jgi:hypothetical protein
MKKSIFLGVSGSLAASGSVSAATISWNAPGIGGTAIGVPVGGVMTLLLAVVLLGAGYWFISRRGKYFQQMAIAAVSASAILFAGGGKIVSDAQAIPLYPVTELLSASGTKDFCETGVHEIRNSFTSQLNLTVVNTVVDMAACGFGDGPRSPAAPDNAVAVPSPECVVGTQLNVGGSCYIEVVFPAG